MKILFLESHPLWIHGLPNGFADLGHTSIISGPLTKENITEMLETFHPDVVVSMGWSPEHSPEKQQWIRQAMSKEDIPLVYWATEDPLHTENFTLPLVKKMKPNFVFTVAPLHSKIYEKKGFKSAHLDFGYHKSIHHPVEPLVKYQCDIAVVANAYPEFLVRDPNVFRLKSLKTLIQPLLEENFRIDFWGKDWNNMSLFLDKKVPKSWIHGYLNYTDANKVYSSAKIVIGLQNCEDQLTQRTYEILGSGGFLLTSDTQAVNEKFQPDKHLIVSSTPEETVEKVSYYLKNGDKRNEIRKNGLKAIKNESYQYRAQQMIDTLTNCGLLGKVHPSDEGKVIHYTDYLKDNYVIHEVKTRETLIKISQKYHVPVEQIMELNRLEDDFLDVGQVLKIKEK